MPILPLNAKLSDTPQPSQGARIIAQLEALMQDRGDEIEAWLEQKRQHNGAPFFASTDIRHAGFKLAPVDVNLFPAGFNHLSPAARLRAVDYMQGCFAKWDGAPKILLIPENHTRNLAYLDNLAALSSLMEQAGAKVHIATLQAVTEPLILQSASGQTITQYPICKEGATLHACDGFTPDLVVLNNDLTSGLPEMLRGITQPITPPPSLGWHRRKKSIYFNAYTKLAKEFAETFDLDPWLITPETYQCGRINFARREGMERVEDAVKIMLHNMRAHYSRYGIDDTPYVYIKADSGTYGMGIMTVSEGDSLKELNKKIRNKMNVIKEGMQTTSVIVQEGIPTIDKVDVHPAEPMLYLVNAHLVGGAYRVNSQRDAMGNLNAKGMSFTRMCDDDEALNALAVPACSFAAYSLVGSLAALATGQEEYGEDYSI
jgi:glutamate--cysteine ligase